MKNRIEKKLPFSFFGSFESGLNGHFSIPLFVSCLIGQAGVSFLVSVLLVNG